MSRPERSNGVRPLVLMWSARFDVENGQAIVTRRVAEGQGGVTWINAIYEPGGGLALVKAALSALRAVLLIALRRPWAVYAVVSRSSVGFWRDAPVLSTALLGARVIVHVHGSDLPDLLARPGIGALARTLYRRCELIVPSAHLVPSLEQLGCRSVTVCENFMAENASPIAAPDYVGGALRLLWNSNLMASKGLRDAIEGARLARQAGVALTFTLLGRPIGDEEASASDMTSYAQSLANESWIDVVGTVSAKEARERVATHDAVLLPSRYSSECQPLALIEAMAAAREIIALDTPALQSTLEGYPARFTDGTCEAIAAQIEALSVEGAARAPRLCEGAKAARSRFSPSRFDAEIAAILTAQPRPRSQGVMSAPPAL